MNKIVVHNERVKFTSNYLLALSIAIVGLALADVTISGFGGLSGLMIATGVAFYGTGSYMLGLLVEPE